MSSGVNNKTKALSLNAAERTNRMDSSIQACLLFGEPVANRSSFCEGVNRMCHNFLLINCGGKSNFTCSKPLNWLCEDRVSLDIEKIVFYTSWEAAGR